MQEKHPSRGSFVTGICALALPAVYAPIAQAQALDQPLSLQSLEARSGGRLGVYAVDTGSGSVVRHRSNERFAMCSTFKLLAVAAMLAQVDSGQERLDRRIAYGTADLQPYAPVARQHLAEGSMTIEALCAAAISYSDNTAANLILRTLGGPSAVTAYARTIGDGVTRLDRYEPGLNSAIPGDPRDTTSPAAMAKDMRALALGNALSPSSRALLVRWLVANTTGRDCLRAGFPPSWRAGDKTGMGGAINAAGDSSTRNDVAVAWPANRAPIVIAAYLTQSTLPATRRDAVLADVARFVVALLRDGAF